MNNIVDLIGKKKAEPEVSSFIDSMNGTCEEDLYGDLIINDYKEHGLCIYFDESSERLSSLFFYSEGKDEHHEYKEELPHNLTFTERRESIISRLGSPSQRKDKWDRFDFEDYFIHITYGPEEMIDLLRIQIHRNQPNKALQSTQTSCAD